MICGIAGATALSPEQPAETHANQSPESQSIAPIRADINPDPVTLPANLDDMPLLRDAGIDATLWGWTTYTASTQTGDHNFASGEIELDLTKTFANRFSLASDIEFVDYDGHTRGNFEQLFGSALLSRESGTVLTIGKFNSPFGAEPRDFWDRLTGTPSLLFRAQPQDLRGAMLTAPIGRTHLTLRPFLVSGFNDEDSIPDRPSVGLMAEYDPNDQFSIAVTNWFGPGLKSKDESSSYSSDEDGYSYSAGGWGDEYSSGYSEASSSEYSDTYGSSLVELTNAWWGPNFKSASKGRLYFLDLQAQWKPRIDLTLVGEFLLASSNANSENQFWDGVMFLANYDIDDHLRVFGQYSFLNDADGEVTGLDQQLQEISAGVGYRVNQHLEFRVEYRHDFSSETDDVDSVSMHASFGY